jgi:hypothetical protein
MEPVLRFFFAESVDKISINKYNFLNYDNLSRQFLADVDSCLL